MPNTTENVEMFVGYNYEHTFITDEVTEEYNSDEYMTLYSSVPMNIKLYSSVTSNRQI